MIPALIPIYGRLVLWKRWTIQQVPEAYQAAVTTWLQEQAA